MKITFIQNNKQDNFKKIRLFLKDTVGNDIQIDLRPGEFVYSETSFITNSLRIYMKKDLIKIEDKSKPEDFKYYVGYSHIDFPAKKVTKESPSVKAVEEPIVEAKEESAEEETKLDATKKAVEKYSSDKRGPGRPKKGEQVKKKKSSKGPGRPKKRGPKKGSKRVNKILDSQ